MMKMTKCPEMSWESCWGMEFMNSNELPSSDMVMSIAGAVVEKRIYEIIHTQLDPKIGPNLGIFVALHPTV